jgi:hypothetical protein
MTNLRNAISLSLLFFLLCLPLALAQSNPVPLINNPLVPDAVAPGGQSFTLTVNGTGFVSGSAVKWNGISLATAFVSSSQLTATVPSANIATPSTASVTVVNPAPGGGASNVDCFSIRNPFPAVSFGDTSINLGALGVALATADLNGDGRLDLITLNGELAGTLSVLLGNGDGTFQTPVQYSIGYAPSGIVAADFNGDGYLDLVFINDPDDTSKALSVMLGNGDGSFQPPVNTTLDISEAFSSTSVGDFNRDGKLDVALAEYPGSQVAVLLGNGDGSFQPPINSSAGNSTLVSLVTGDFNKDGKLDLAVSTYSPSSVEVLMGNGDGTFQTGGQNSITGNPSQIVTADFNGDGNLDLAIDIGEAFAVLLGDGDGTFQSPVDYQEGPGSFPSLAASDLNGDGIVDIVAGETSGLFVYTYLGKGDGTFPARQSFPAPGNAQCCVVIGDFNGDGLADLAQNTASFDSILILPQSTAVLSTTHIDFGTVKIGSTITRSVLLSNFGSAPFSINQVKLRAKQRIEWTQSNDCGTSLQAGASCTITVTFKPDSTVHVRATLSISDTAATGLQTVALTGQGF